MSEPAQIWTTHEDMKTRNVTPLQAKNGATSRIKSSYMVGVQSRFRRKYYHKTVLAILVLIILLLIIVIIVVSCLLSSAADDVCRTKECLRSSAMFLQNMDFTAEPCEDFFQFTCGNFEEEHPRPDTQTSHDWFTERQTKVLRDIRAKLQMKANITDEPLPVQQAKMLYQSCIDTAVTDKLEFGPIFEYLKAYSLPKFPTLVSDSDAKNYKFDWIKTIVKVKRSLGADKLIGFEIFPDPKNRTLKYLAIGSPSSENDLPLVDDVLSKRMNRMRRKWSIASVELENSEDEDVESLTDSDVALIAYALYMNEVITAIIKKADPAFKINESAEKITNAIRVTIGISKKIYSFIDAAENASKAEDRDGNLSDLVYIKVSELQKLIDDELPTKEPFPVFQKYLTSLLSGIPEAHFDMDHDIVLTSNADILYLKLALNLIAQTRAVDLEAFIWWSVIEDLVLYTTSNMRQLYYDYSKTITGVESSTSRSTYCTSSINRLMGMAVSFLIVEKDFVTETKPKVEGMLNNIRDAFNNLVSQASWMDSMTKESTLQKSQAMTHLIGFPNYIFNRTLLENKYKGIKIKSDTWMENIVHLLSWQFMEKLSTWRMKNEFDWATSPTNVNAFHTFQANAITIPLAILQFPFYHLGLEALNYGSIGSILAHELTHGFDDIGRHFDKEGNKKLWWSNYTITEFLNRTECFKKQYSNFYLPEIGEYINGETTLGENIADNGGLREAYYAYNYYRRSNGNEEKLPGFTSYTHDQLFFMSFGNLWCESMTATGLKFSLEDTHCPGKIRLRGVLSNSKEFQNAFKCHAGQKYHRTDDEKCIIW